MLVLTRKIGEEIRIGDDITVKVTSVQGGRVKLGIDAPRHRKITRPETVPVESNTESTSRPQQSGIGGVSYASAAR